MKILYITPNKFDNSGGGICAENLYLSIKEITEELEVYSPNDMGIVAQKNRINDILSRALGHSNFMYMDWLKNRQRLLEKKYDVIILSNSRLGFIAKYLKKHNYKGKVITHFDNIEFDYCDEYSKKFNSFKALIFKLIEKKNIQRDENMAIKYSDKCIYLTKRDEIRAKELYKMSTNDSVIPICLKNQQEELKVKHDKISLVFLGSLWYPPNIEAITWFVEKVWKNSFEENENIELIIAGSRPTERVIQYKNIKNISVIGNFKTISDIVPINSIFISPIINGAGMKVKIAEALSIGIPIIASTESLIGYDEVIESEFVLKADTVEEYIKSINLFVKNKNINKDTIKELFNKYYSLERCTEDLKKIISS